MALNMDTIWNETYKATHFDIGHRTSLHLVTAIHNSGKIVADLEIKVRSEHGTGSACAALSAEQMERIAAALLVAANRRRALDTMLACHLAGEAPTTDQPEAA